MEHLSTWGTVNLLNTADLSQPLKIKMYYLLLHSCVSQRQKEVSEILLGVKMEIRDKNVVCTFWCEVSVYYIYIYIYVSIFIFLVKMWIFIKM